MSQPAIARTDANPSKAAARFWILKASAMTARARTRLPGVISAYTNEFNTRPVVVAARGRAHAWDQRGNRAMSPN